MLVITLFVSIGVLLFMVGLLLMAHFLKAELGDPSASYPLYKVRDQLVHAVVFEGVDKNDPWFSALYENVNDILTHSGLLAGPDGWPLAVAVGKHLANNPQDVKALVPLPTDVDCPAPLKNVSDDLVAALRYLLSNHVGIYLQRDSKRKESRKIQEQKSKKFLDMIRPRDRLAAC